MESRRIFLDGMDNDPADHNAVQDFAQRALDHVVGDGVTSGRKFAGFEAAASGVTTLSVAPGRFYSGGKVYNRDTAFAYDFTTALPVAAKKVATVVIWGEEVDTDARAREFLINEETGASEPRVVALERARVARISVSIGGENADPVAPLLDSSVVAVAQVVLTTAGIQSVTMIGDNVLDSVSSLAGRTGALETFRRKAEPQIASLGSDIAALTAGQAGLVNRDMYGRSLARLAVLESKAGIPAGAVDSAADYFLELGATDTAFAGYSAKVEEGIRFPNAAAATKQLQIFNALNPLAKITGGVMFPAYNRVKRMSVGPRSGEVQISSYTYATHQMVQKMTSRVRVRFGGEMTVCTNSAWWSSGRYDPTTRTFRTAGETWQVAAADAPRALINHQFVRVTQFFQDSYEEPYWEAVTVNHAVNGSQVAETFLNSNDLWLDAIGLTFTRLAAGGNVTVAICETDRGMPLLNKIISKTEVDRASLVLNAETIIPIQPTFLVGGVRYALVVITAADHWLATVQGSAYPQGTFFYVLDGAYQQGDATRDLAFSLYAAEFTASRAVIDLGALELAGGIAAIDIIAPAIVPGSSQLTFEVQINSVWVPLAAAANLVLGAGGTIPPLLPFRVVFTGTPDVMPGLTLTGSQVIVSRPATTLKHFSKPRTLPGAGSLSVRVIERLEYFKPANHTATCQLRVGAGYATIETADAITDVVADDGSIERTFVFNLAAAATSYVIESSATTDSALNTFHFGWRKDYAL